MTTCVKTASGMPAEVVWSFGSLAGLTAITSLIAADNPRAAQEVAAQIKARTRQLEQFPLSGRHFDRTPHGEIRELVVLPDRIFYLVREDRQRVSILRTWYTARGVPDLPPY